MAAVAAVGPAARHVRLTAEADDAVAAAAPLDEDARAIVEHGSRIAAERAAKVALEGRPRAVTSSRRPR
jgi:hypothetical protein